jgi:hypothetical protein
MRTGIAKENAHLPGIIMRLPHPDEFTKKRMFLILFFTI